MPEQVVLVAAIVTKSGKGIINGALPQQPLFIWWFLLAILSRQFCEIQRSRVEGLLAAFPKLTSAGKQHTTIETENVRYVYQPLEELFMVLVTNRQVHQTMPYCHILKLIAISRSPTSFKISNHCICLLVLSLIYVEVAVNTIFPNELSRFYAHLMKSLLRVIEKTSGWLKWRAISSWKVMRREIKRSLPRYDIKKTGQVEQGINMVW